MQFFVDEHCDVVVVMPASPVDIAAKQHLRSYTFHVRLEHAHDVALFDQMTHVGDPLFSLFPLLGAVA